MQTATSGPAEPPLPPAAAPSLGPGSSAIRPTGAVVSVPSSRVAAALSSTLVGSVTGWKGTMPQNPLR